MNKASIHNYDITHVLGLQHVSSHKGRLTHYLLKTNQPNGIYKYSTLLYDKDETDIRMDIEYLAYSSRYYLRLIGSAIVEYVGNHPGCTQADISRGCMGLDHTDYSDNNWIASQLLNVMNHHNILCKYKNNLYVKGARTHITLVDGGANVCQTMFQSAYADVKTYINNKKIGTVYERSYADHLMLNARAFGIDRIELQKVFDGLDGVGGKPLRYHIYLEQEGGTKRLIEIDHPYNSVTSTQVEHDRRKLEFSILNEDEYVLVRMDLF